LGGILCSTLWGWCIDDYFLGDMDLERMIKGTADYSGL
jgi:hypothetical protein